MIEAIGFPSRSPNPLFPGTGPFDTPPYQLLQEVDIPPHDPELVEVIAQRGKLQQEYLVVCPQAGKAYCFSDFRKSLSQLPLNKSHVVFYDNSNSPAHGRRIKRVADALDSVTIIRDKNRHVTVDATPQQQLLLARCGNVYEQLYSMLPQTGSRLVINLEDDIGAPAGGVERLLTAIDSYDELGTVIGDCRCRRAKMLGDIEGQPIVCNFQKLQGVGGDESESVLAYTVPPKPFGLECVGSGHMGLWITKKECLDDVGMTYEHAPPRGHDIQFGLRANEKGWRFAVDWSVRLEHYFQDQNRKASV